MKEKVKFILNSLLGLFYPDYCVGCGEPLVSGEHYICTNCVADLPYTYFNDSRKNLVNELFWGRITKLDRSYSLCYFKKKSSLQKLLHSLKYKNRPEVGQELGIFLANELKKVDLTDFDILLPVPLHPKKEKKRGYNQSTKIAEGIAQVISKPIDTRSVVRRVFTETQTKKGKIERWENVKDIFQVKKPQKLTGKHILIVDDVITTGATIEALASVIEREVEDVKISITSVAIAKKV